MAKPVNLKKTFSFGKLAKKLDNIIVADVNALGNAINKAIQDGIDSGKDINGQPFAPLEPITKELGGTKPLNRTGNMRKTKKTPATIAKKQFVIEMVGKSKKGKGRQHRVYGAFHNTGFKQTNKKQWFYGSKVPKREWFGISKTMKPEGSAYKKAILERAFRIRSAWRKKF